MLSRSSRPKQRPRSASSKVTSRRAAQASRYDPSTSSSIFVGAAATAARMRSRCSYARSTYACSDGRSGCDTGISRRARARLMEPSPIPSRIPNRRGRTSRPLVRRLSILSVLVLTALCVAAASASASSRLRIGLTDSGGAYFDEGDLFPLRARTHARVLRVQLYWGGARGVSRTRPAEPLEPSDPAYDWSDADRVVLASHAEGTSILFSIFGTPWWANGSKAMNRAPRNQDDLWNFAYAAATRYSGTYEREDGVVLPAVRLWTAWNEPNLTLGLVPQWRKVRGHWIAQSAVDYARICNAVTDGIHATLIRNERVACGVTAARGNNNPRGKRQSVSPIAFMRAMKKAGAQGFDAYAPHPYPGGPFETPSAPPKGPTAIGLGNIGTLTAEVTR